VCVPGTVVMIAVVMPGFIMIMTIVVVMTRLSVIVTGMFVVASLIVPMAGVLVFVTLIRAVIVRGRLWRRVVRFARRRLAFTAARQHKHDAEQRCG